MKCYLGPVTGSIAALLLTVPEMVAGGFPFAAPRPIGDINKAGGSNPQVVGTVGDSVLFTASKSAKARHLYAKKMTHKGGGLDLIILPQDIENKKYKPKTLVGMKGDVDDFVELEPKSSPDIRQGFFHEKGKGLWTTKGTGPSTHLVKKTDKSSTDESLMMSELVLFDADGKFFDSSSKRYKKPYLLFAAPTPKNGKELWLSDGTSGGTKFFRDLNPGPGDSQIKNMSVYYPYLGESFGSKAFGTCFDAESNSYFIFRFHRDQDSGGDITERYLGVGPLEPTALTATPDGFVYFNLFTLTSTTEEVWGLDVDFQPTDSTTYFNISAFDENPANIFPLEAIHYDGFQFGFDGNYYFSGLVSGDREPYYAFAGFEGQDGSGVKRLGNNPTASSNPRSFTVCGDFTYFVATASNGEHLYRTGGFTDDAEDLGQFTNIREITPVIDYLPGGGGQVNGDDVYFVADSGQTTGILYRCLTVDSTSNDRFPTPAVTDNSNIVTGVQNLVPMLENGIFYLFFTTEGAGTEYENLPNDQPRGREVWYCGGYANNN